MAEAYNNILGALSLPSRGAWIEISPPAPCDLPAPGRSPRGERGLKLDALGETSGKVMSLPSRGAWIEMGEADSAYEQKAVAPLAGSVD